LGIVDADAPLASERPSPAAPSAFTVAPLVVRFCAETRLTRDMIAPPKVVLVKAPAARVRSTNPARKGYQRAKVQKNPIEFPFIFVNESAGKRGRRPPAWPGQRRSHGGGIAPVRLVIRP